jgi:DNA polymerase bacteriophage-type
VKQVDVRGMPMEYGAAVAMASQASAKAGFKIAVADVLNACLRHMVKADNLLVADYAGVEARGCAWVAGERRMLEVFSDPDANIYIDMGEKVFGRRVSKYADVQEYQLAKSLVLGCGYGMSGAKFEFTCKMRGTRAETLEKMGLSIADCVKVYRDSYPRIPAVWREYGRAAMETVRDGACRRAGRCDFYMEDNHLHLVLPSGRPIVYRNARIEKMVPGWAKFQGITMAPIDTVVFDKARGGMGFLYGSKICENAVQALCRDLLAHAIVECERVGLNPTLHVHDELVCQAEESRLAEMLEIMSVPPAWAEDFPIQIEGYSGPVWTKQSAGFTEGLAVNGKVLKLGK